MAQHVDKIVHYRGDLLALQFVEFVCQPLACLQVGDLVVGGFPRDAQPVKQRLLQGLFVGILGPLFMLPNPKLWHDPGNVPWGHSGKEGVPRILGGRGQNAEVGLLLLHGPIRPQGWRNGAPLVPTQIVNDHQKHRSAFCPLDRLGQPFRQKPVGHHGRLFEARHPMLVMRLHEPGKLLVRLGMLVFQNLQHATVPRSPKLGMPMAQSLVNLCPFVCVEPAAELHGEFAKLPHVGRLGLLPLQTTVVQGLLDGQQDLVGVDWLDEVVADFGANGLLHDVLFLAFGDHDDRQLWPFVLDPLQGFNAVDARHVFVQKNHIKGVGFYLFEGFHPAVDTGHVVSLFLQKHDVRLQQIDFVVCPKNVWSSHDSLLSCKSGHRRRWRHTYLATK